MGDATDGSEEDVLAWASQTVGRAVSSSELGDIIAKQLAKDNPSIQTRLDLIRQYAESAGGTVLSVVRTRFPEAWGLPRTPPRTVRWCASALGMPESEVKRICLEMWGVIGPQYAEVPSAHPLVVPDAIRRYLDQHHPGWSRQ
jgi:hypothetical protein